MSEAKRTITLSDAYRVLKEDRKNLFIYIGVAAILGIIVAFSIPRIYKTTVVLAPEESSGGLIGNISSLASMVGMDMSFDKTGDAIYPEIYPDILGSTDFLVSLFPIQVTTKDKSRTCDYATHLTKYGKVAWWDYPMIGAKKAIKALKKKEPQRKVGEPIDPFCLTMDEYELCKAISSNINCIVDKKTSVISITVTDQDPRVSALMADSIQQRLQTYITDYRTKKARNDVAYLEKIFAEAKQQYREAEQAYASYSEGHFNTVMESANQKRESLKSELQLRENIYTTVAQQLQLAKAKVQERTPAFTTIQSASMPAKHSNKPKVLVLAIWMFLGALLRGCILVWRNKELLLE